MNKLALSLIIGALTVVSLASNADTLGKCKDAKIMDNSLFNDVPWGAMYPIKIAGVQLSRDGSGAPDGATNKTMCTCDDSNGLPVLGITNSMYEPARLIELVREPDCMMTLGGMEANITNGRMRGTIGANETDEGDQAAFWHYHYYAYPLLLMLEMVIPNRCGDGYLSMDLMYISEVDPTWNDAEMSFFANPEATIFANPISISACIGDAAAASVGKSIDSLYWCAGAWGGIYPINGYVSTKGSIPSKTSLLATRSVAALHRRLLARQTMGDDALCSAPIFPTIPKSQYKMNMMYPVPESGGDGHEIGEPALLWGEWRNVPTKEDNIYLLWRWNDCCTTLY